MLPLLEKLFCIPATSAPVERVFSHGGIILRPHRARMSDDLLSSLVYMKSNRHVNSKAIDTDALGTDADN